MPNQKVDDKSMVKEHIQKLKRIEEGYLNIIEDTLKAFKEQKNADIHHLEDIEYLKLNINNLS